MAGLSILNINLLQLLFLQWQDFLFLTLIFATFIPAMAELSILNISFLELLCLQWRDLGLAD